MHESFNPRRLGLLVAAAGLGGTTVAAAQTAPPKVIPVPGVTGPSPAAMTPEMVADAAKTIQPKILYPYHYGNTDPFEAVRLLKDETAIEVRIRDLR